MMKVRTLRTFLITLLVCLMIYIYPQNTIFILFVSYICSGVIEYFWRISLKRQPKRDLEIEVPDGKSWEIKRKA